MISPFILSIINCTTVQTPSTLPFNSRTTLYYSSINWIEWLLIGGIQVDAEARVKNNAHELEVLENFNV